MRTIVLGAVALAVFSWCPISSAEELTQVFASTEGFTIKLPQGWGRIDKSTLQASAGELTEALPNSQQLKAKTKQVIDGFQPEPAQSGVGYPRILVIADRVGRVSDDDLRQSARLSAQVVQGEADSAIRDNSWNASTKVDEMIYDESGH